MTTKRQIIDSFRNKLRERNADSNYSNQFLYNTLFEHASWLIRREIASGRIYSNTDFFQTLTCVEVIETSLIDPCCPIKSKCKIYRTKDKIPDAWLDSNGPVLKRVTSVDSSTEFMITTSVIWSNKVDDPYQKMIDTKYTFYANEYLWFPVHNPHRINIDGFWVDDISLKSGCSPIKECVRFLDTKFPVPSWLIAEMMAKALEQVAGISKRLPEDNDINKNPTRKD